MSGPAWPQVSHPPLLTLDVIFFLSGGIICQDKKISFFKADLRIPLEKVTNLSFHKNIA